MPTPREIARSRTLAEIRERAWRALETDGAAGLSLRALARDLGIVSSAIYRYVPSRDELLTQLVVEGYEDLAATAERAHAAVAGGEPRERWSAVARAVRNWALARPAAWALLYGSPVPGYRAPAERTTAAGTRVMALLAQIVRDAVAAGSWRAGLRPPAVALRTGLVAAADELTGAAQPPSSPEAVAATVLGWTMLVATVSSQVFEQLGPDPFGDPQAWFDHQLAISADLAGLA